MIVMPIRRRSLDSPFLLFNFKGAGGYLFMGNHKFYWDLGKSPVNVLRSDRVTKEQIC